MTDLDTSPHYRVLATTNYAPTGFSTVGGIAEAGYSWAFGKGVVAAELSYRYAPTAGGRVVTQAITYQPYSTKAEHDIAIAALGGYRLLDKVLLYAAIGFHETRFTYEVTETNSNVHATSAWQPGIAPGLGLKVAFSKRISMDLRYSYVFYGSENKSILEYTSAGGTDYTGSGNKPSVSQVS